MELTKLKEILDKVAPSYHLTYEPSDVAELRTPIIIFSRVSSTFNTYSDDRSNLRATTFQINLISKDSKEMDSYSKKLEETLAGFGLPFTLTSEYLNENKTITVIYEIRTEETINVK